MNTIDTNKTKIEKAVANLANSAYDIELKDENSDYKDYSKLRLVFYLKENHPIIKHSRKFKDYREDNYKWYNDYECYKQEYNELKEKSPQEWIKKLVPYYLERNSKTRGETQKFFNSPCPECQEPLLMETRDVIEEIKVKKLYCVMCNMVWNWELELDKKLDPDYDEKGRMLTLSTAMKKEYERRLVRTKEEKKKTEEKIEWLSKKISSIEENYGKQKTRIN